MNEKKESSISVHHDFDSKEYVAGWAERAAPTPERNELFSIILKELKDNIPENGLVVELGIGPGYLASFVLSQMPDITYTGVDFSKPMLDIADGNLKKFSNNISFIKANLITEDWWSKIDRKVDAVISTCALHDLGGQENTKFVYNKSKEILKPGGLLINGDAIKPEQTEFDYEPGRFELSKHFQILKELGFKNIDCLLKFKTDAITSGLPEKHTCACMKAQK